ncbi:secreted protein containing Peptidase M23 domain protein, partial [human gut metagenome]
MRRLLISALLLCSAPVSAQHLAPEDYIFPLRDVAGLYSANFGEMRPNHFHSGIDIKTDGVTGKPVLATADGYISRIAVTPGGYGRAIYITHPNGTTSVYGHLSKFRDDIEKIRTRGALPHPAKQHQSLSLGRPVSAQTGRAVRLVGKYRLVRRPAPAFRDPRLPHAADP